MEAKEKLAKYKLMQQDYLYSQAHTSQAERETPINLSGYPVRVYKMGGGTKIRMVKFYKYMSTGHVNILQLFKTLIEKLLKNEKSSKCCQRKIRHALHQDLT